MKVTFYGGQLDGHKMEMGSYFPSDWRVPKRPRASFVIVEGDEMPATTVFTSEDVYRLVRDPWRGPAYCYVGTAPR